MVTLPSGSADATHTCLMSWVDGNRSQVSWCHNCISLCTVVLRTLSRCHHVCLDAPHAGGRTHLMSLSSLLRRLLFADCEMPDEASDVVDEDSEHFFNVYSEEFSDVYSDVYINCATP